MDKIYISDQDRITAHVDGIAPDLIAISDQIYDLAETGLKEYGSSKLLEDYLQQEGFQVERGLAGLPTAFKAVWEHGEGGPSIGFLCEYDALPMGHGCGHHMQGPAILGAVSAIKALYRDQPYRLVVYGTPAEETIGGKILMQERGCFQDIDVALMTHGSPTTCVDIKSMALENFVVTFHGVSAHAAMSPDQGRSALDAALLSFQGIEFLREHVKEDTRIHYTIRDAGGPPNVVPEKAVAEYTLRSYDTDYLHTVVARFLKVIEGAAHMTETTFTLQQDPAFKAKIPCLRLNDVIMEQARRFGAPRCTAPREKTGSTDFGNVMYEIPGCCLRIAFAPEGSAAHSQEYLDAGKSEAGHQALLYSARILAAVGTELIGDQELMQEIQEEFRRKKG